LDIKLTPSVIGGKVSAIASKSDVHRLMICAALCDSDVTIKGVSRCADTDATASCIEALGARVTYNGRDCTVTPPKARAGKVLLDCGESGSTLRFLLPVAAILAQEPSFIGSGRLPQRPIGELVDAMTSGGACFSADKLPLTVSGGLKAGRYSLPGNVSSQYVSGLLMALSCVEGESFIDITTPLQSASYVDMTLSTLKLFGSDVSKMEKGYRVKGREKLTSPKIAIADGDWSNGSFFLVSGAIGGSVTVKGLFTDSVQGDRKVLDALRSFGAKVTINGDEITVSHNKMQGCTIDLTDTPDLLPILAVAAAFAEGQTRFTGGERLRLKESDRLQTTADMLRSMGGKVEILPDGLIVDKVNLTGGTVDGANDHRIVMAASIAAAHGSGDVIITGVQAVNKSYPDFFEDFAQLGGKADVITVR